MSYWPHPKYTPPWFVQIKMLTKRLPHGSDVGFTTGHFEVVDIDTEVEAFVRVFVKAFPSLHFRKATFG